ncbi:MAG: patatin-like phospholipase family protein [bacterium]
MKLVFRLFLLLCVSSVVTAHAKPRVGLVLSGGGARGAAHIGILRYLEEQQIPIDVIAGTSMGAIVGGLYASGYSANEIEKITTEMDWTLKLTDNVPRQDRSIQRKRLEDIFSIPGYPGFSEGQIKLPSGAIQGQNIILELQRITHHVADISDFNKLPIPFHAIATNIVNGEMVLLDHGDLAVAMRASMGVPAVFAPIVIDGKFLVDGGVTNNLPMDVARQIGADLLIVIDIGSPLLDQSKVKSFLSITDQLTRMLTGRNSTEQLATLTTQDVLITPQLGDLTAGDFAKAAEAIAIGYKAAVAAAPELAKLKRTAGSHTAISKPQPSAMAVNKITLNNTSGLNDQLLNDLIKISSGDTLDLAVLEVDLTRIHGLGNFQHVGYSLIHRANGVDLDLTTIAKSWGPNYLHFGIEAQSEFENDLRANLIGGYTREEVTDKGAEWTSILGIGTDPNIETIWYQPLTYTRDWYFYSRAGYSDEVVSDFIGDEKISEFSLRQARIYTGIGYEFGPIANIQLGLSRTTGKLETQVGDPAIPDSEFDDGDISLLYLVDTRDDRDFPSRGSLVELQLSASRKNLGADENYQQWELSIAKFYAWDKHNLGLSTQLGGTNGFSNAGSVFRLGGYGQITGLRTDQLKGNYKGILSAIYYRRFDSIPVVNGFIGGIAEYGGAWDNRKDISTDSALFSLGAFVAAETPIGTLQLGTAFTDQGDSTIFSRIGRVF